MDETSFQLPVAGYEVLVRIILGYYHAGGGNEPVPVSAVAESTAMKAPNVSANNKFLQSVGILERVGKGYQLTSSGLHLAQALDYDKESKVPETQSIWANIVNNNDFLQRMTSAVKIRGNMDSEAFARHIALTSGAPNKPRFMRGARTVIAMLQAAGKLVEDEDGTLKVIEEQPVAQTVPSPPAATTVAVQGTAIASEPLPSVLFAGIPFSIMIQITPGTTDSELQEIARKIRYLSDLFASSDLMREEDAEVS
jgi:hypothetical protein